MILHIRTVAKIALLAMSAAVSFLPACSGKANCNAVRERAYADKLVWDACDPTDTNPNQCIVFPGIAKDCTGIFTCNWAVNAKYRNAAEQGQLRYSMDSADCHECAIPNCPDGKLALCEPVSKRCMIISDFVPNTPGAGADASTSLFDASAPSDASDGAAALDQ